MRLSLEQLKAMSDKQLYAHWLDNRFPFEQLPDCKKCLTQHGYYALGDSCGHEQLASNVLSTDERFGRVANIQDGIAGLLRTHLEELYALRLFFDSLYSENKRIPAETPAPQPAEQSLETRNVLTS